MSEAMKELERLKGRSTPKAPIGGESIGLTTEQASSFSFLRYARAIAKPDSQRYEKEAGTELEAVRAASQKDPGADGRALPREVLNAAYRAPLTVVSGTNATAANLLSDTPQSGSFNAELQQQSELMEFSTVLTNLQGSVTLPYIGNGVDFSVQQETLAADAADGTTLIQSNDIAPLRVYAWVPVSNQALIQSNPSVEQMFRTNLAQTLAATLDRWAWSGRVAANETPNLYDLILVNAVTPPNQTANGDNADWNLVGKMVEQLTSLRGLTSNVRWGMSSLLAVRMMGTRRSTGASGVPDPIMEYDGSIARIPSIVSANFLNNANKGSATNLSRLILGNFTHFVMGFWGETRVVVDPYTYSRRGYTAIGIETFTNNAVVDPNAFVRADDLISAY